MPEAYGLRGLIYAPRRRRDRPTTASAARCSSPRATPTRCTTTASSCASRSAMPEASACSTGARDAALPRRRDADDQGVCQSVCRPARRSPRPALMRPTRSTAARSGRSGYNLSEVAVCARRRLRAARFYIRPRQRRARRPSAQTLWLGLRASTPRSATAAAMQSHWATQLTPRVTSNLREWPAAPLRRGRRAVQARARRADLSRRVAHDAGRGRLPGARRQDRRRPSARCRTPTSSIRRTRRSPYNLSEVLYRNGQFERARFYIRRVNSRPELASAQTLWLAARIEHKLGQEEQVKAMGAQLRDRFPDVAGSVAVRKGQVR